MLHDRSIMYGVAYADSGKIQYTYTGDGANPYCVCTGMFTVHSADKNDFTINITLKCLHPTVYALMSLLMTLLTE
jgi:hypothetical protein